MAAPRSRAGGRRIDPFLVFLCLAAVAFVVAGQIGDDAVALHDDAGELREELAALERKLGRTPSAKEREDLTRRWLEREVLYREAVALGLAERDPVIKTQLVRAMTHLLRSSAPIEEPTDEALQAWISEDLDRYGVPARWSLEIVAPPPTGRFLNAEGAESRTRSNRRPTAVGLTRRSAARHRRADLIRPMATLRRRGGRRSAATWRVGQTTEVPSSFVQLSDPAAALLDEVRGRARGDRSRGAIHVRHAIARLAEGYSLSCLPRPERWTSPRPGGPERAREATP